MGKIVGVKLFLALLTLPCLGLAQNKSVGVYANLADGTTGQGTAFFITPTRAVTVYHVLRNARSVTISFEGRQFTRVTVAAIHPEADLAMLDVADATGVPLHVLATDTRGHSAAGEVTVVGYARGLPNQVFRGNLTQAGYLRSEQLRDSQGRPLFSSTGLELLPIDVTVYSGLSGAPVISDGQVIGVLSGSLHEGRALTWAIPIAHLARSQAVALPPSAISSWPALFVTRHWRSLNRTLRLDSGLKQAVDDHFSAVEALSAATEDCYPKARLANAWLGMLKTLAEQSARARQLPDGAFALWEKAAPIVDTAAKCFDSHGLAVSKVHAIDLRLVEQMKADERKAKQPRTKEYLKAARAGAREIRDWSAALKELRTGLNARYPDSASLAKLALKTRRDASDAEVAQEFAVLMRTLEAMTGDWVESAPAQARLAAHYREFGRIVEKYGYMETEAATPETYFSKHGYSVVMQRGWIPLDAETQEYLSAEWFAWTQDGRSDMAFARTGFAGVAEPPAVLRTRPITGRLEEKDLGVLGDHADEFFGVPGVHSLVGGEVSLGENKGLAVEGHWGDKQKPGRVYAALVFGPERSVWIRCAASARDMLDECKAAAKSVRFH